MVRQGGQPGWVNTITFRSIHGMRLGPARERCRKFAQKYSISYVIFAVLPIMAATEQYFVSDSRTASSTAL